MKNQPVAQNWVKGEYARNGKGTFHTDGRSLYSYAMLIGMTLKTGEKVLLNLYTPFKVSATTTQHCMHARHAMIGAPNSRMIDPEIVSSSWGSYSRYAFPREYKERQEI